MGFVVLRMLTKTIELDMKVLGIRRGKMAGTKMNDLRMHRTTCSPPRQLLPVCSPTGGTGSHTDGASKENLI